MPSLLVYTLLVGDGIQNLVPIFLLITLLKGQPCMQINHKTRFSPHGGTVRGSRLITATPFIYFWLSKSVLCFLRMEHNIALKIGTKAHQESAMPCWKAKVQYCLLLVENSHNSGTDDMRSRPKNGTLTVWKFLKKCVSLPSKHTQHPISCERDPKTVLSITPIAVTVAPSFKVDLSLIKSWKRCLE